MIIVIDAYNLLHVIPSYRKNLTDQERVQFIKQLGVYGRRKGHKIVLVFDGGRFEWPYKEKLNSVYIIYSGVHESADDCIKEYLTVHRAKDILLVSSDIEINQFAERLSIPSIDSIGFYELLQEFFNVNGVASKQQENVVKMTQDSNSVIDALMNAAQVPAKADDIAQKSEKRVKDKQISKQERALLKKLHKL